MTDKPGWRRTYDTAERAVAPRAEALVRSSEYAVADRRGAPASAAPSAAG